jgi:hypothetical protein
MPWRIKHREVDVTQPEVLPLRERLVDTRDAGFISLGPNNCALVVLLEIDVAAGVVVVVVCVEDVVQAPAAACTNTIFGYHCDLVLTSYHYQAVVMQCRLNVRWQRMQGQVLAVAETCSRSSLPDRTIGGRSAVLSFDVSAGPVAQRLVY